jgi:outer membrane receptor for ferrienterochelin and colicin
MRLRVLWLAALVACVGVHASAFAQGNTTGAISGRATDQFGGVLPNVTVTATSPALPGARATLTSPQGDFMLAFLPPGEYTVMLELEAFKTVTHVVRVAATQTVPLNATLEVAGVSETVTVTASRSDVVSRAATTATAIKQEVVEQLPLNRGLDATAAIAPGVLRSGITSRTTGLGVIAIGGAPSYENLFLMNGVVLNENLRGQPIGLYIEDAIQETTVVTSGVSAEFGRFSGGMVNAVTKSGGNAFNGTFRSTFENDDWRSRTPLNEAKTDKLIPTYEYTFGGPVLRDKIWFFTAGRLVEETRAFQTQFTNQAWNRVRDEKRYEGKVTYAVDARHTLKGSYLYKKTITEGDAFSTNILDLASLTNREDPENLLALNYNGIFGGGFFLEAQYSAREGSASGAGSRYTDLIQGTLLVDNVRGARYNSPTFCGVCRTEERDNSDIAVKGSWFLSTPRWGSHNVVVGYDTFNDMRAADNHQSGSDWRIMGTTAILADGDVFPVFNNDGRSTVLQWNPILLPTAGTNFRMHSAYANDTWRWTDRVSLNLGLRFDRNQGRDAAGTLIGNDQKVSPRLGLTWDPRANGVWTVNGSYGIYVASLNSTIANGASIAGNPTTLQWAYTGPAINTSGTAPFVTREEAIRTVFDWFNATGGTSRPLVGVNLPGVQVRIPETLVSPSATEYAGGVTRRLGSRGMLRVDTTYRDFADFYSNRVDATTGRIQVDPLTLQEVASGGRPLDVRLIQNTNDVSRQYAAMNTMLTWHAAAGLDLSAAYTLSRTWGNFDLENESSGPFAAQAALYPEYREERWNYPSGDLIGDQRHKGRVWGTWRVPMNERFGGVSLGALFNVDSSTPYGAVGIIDPSPYVTGVNYVTPVTQAQYYFAARDEYRTEASTRTDLAVTYDYRFGGPRRVALFVKADVVNLFDQAALVNPFFVDQTVLTASNAPTRFQRFNPFLDTPVQGTNWEFGPNFGKAVNRFAYQPPRQVRVAVGVRF